jgi:ubiquinone biosynthesis monooxygenase Coq7
MTTRHFSFIDKILMQVDAALQTLFTTPPTCRNIEFPKNTQDLSAPQQRLSASLMRVNHSGEVCAQALYQSQAIFARSPNIKKSLLQSADEENDHLNWCKIRVEDLNSHTSFLNPLWYCGSFIIGTFAGALGDKWSLGFIVETERQVAKHLDSHLTRLPAADQTSRDIVQQMKYDEMQHAATAAHNGGAELPYIVKAIMAGTAKIMTVSAFYI